MSTTLTKSQRDEIKADLAHELGMARFLIDGYYILAVVKADAMRLKIMVYVDDWVRGEWMWCGKESELAEMPEVTRKFYCLTRRNIYNAKQIKVWERFYGSKTKAKACGVYEKHCSSSWFFSSPSAFISHIQKHNDSIELLSADRYRLGLNRKRGGKC